MDFDFDFDDEDGCTHTARISLNPADISGADPDDVLNHIGEKLREVMEETMSDRVPYSYDSIFDQVTLEDEIKDWMDDKKIPYGPLNQPSRKTGSWGRGKARQAVHRGPAKKKANKKKAVSTGLPSILRPAQDDEREKTEREREMDFWFGRGDKDKPQGGGLFGIPKSFRKKR